MILTPLQKLPNNLGDLGKTIVATGFEWLPKVNKIAQSGHTGRELSQLFWYFIFFKWTILGLFFFTFVFALHLAVNKNVLNKRLPMTGFDPRTSGIGSNHSTN